MADKYIYNNSGQLTEKAAITTSAGAGDSGKIPALDGSGRLDTSMLPVGLSVETTSLPTSENLAAGDFVNIYDNAGTVTARKADASAGNAKKADGFVLAAVTSPASATIYYGNLNTALTSLTKGSIYYLSTGGGVTTTAPSTATHIVQRLGKAISTTSLLVEIQDTITLA